MLINKYTYRTIYKVINIYWLIINIKKHLNVITLINWIKYMLLSQIIYYSNINKKMNI
jgi:hypothetical protein